jgi:adenosylcobinamide kinase/adenosylcobinamide-phosphate guanylyltransferase
MADSNNMADKKIILVGGGARSGKSRFALSLARRLGERRLFLATAKAHDDEMRTRIEAHRDSRGPGFSTLEEPKALADVLRDRDDVDVVVIDCLTLWLSNLLLDENTPSQIETHVSELAEVLRRQKFHAVMVTNEVGLGIVPETPLGRIFRDVAGSAHQALSEAADEVYFAVLGTMLRLKPAPAFVPWDEIA